MRKENGGGPREEAERLGVQGDSEGVWGYRVPQCYSQTLL